MKKTLNSSDTFGSYIRRLRIKNDIGQRELAKKINKSKTKVLIVAAGLGSRLKDHTENLPKCMLDFGGKTLLERQVSAYRNCGIDNISVVKGYQKSKINYKKLNYFWIIFNIINNIRSNSFF